MRFLFLALLAAGPAHGYELKRAYDERFGAVWGRLNIGQVYTTMARLERDGLVSRENVAQGDRPDKKVYALTDAGRTALATWLDEAEDAPALKSDLILKLFAARLTGADPAPVVARQRQRYLQALRDVDRLGDADGHDPVAALLIEGAALHLDAQIRWLDACERRLGELRGAGSAPEAPTPQATRRRERVGAEAAGADKEETP
jgi:DNA-binding PadR family transcriptional regulator